MQQSPSSPMFQRLRRNRLIRLLSNLWFGMSFVLLILIYACVASAFPHVRSILEMTEMEIFRHWLFNALIIMFALSLTLATIFRVRWSRINIGVLTVHAGLLLLVIGCFVYFGTKVEGDVTLMSPRIEVLGPSGEPLGGARMLAAPGQQWSANMPALGGATQLEVVETSGDGFQPVTSATVRVATKDGTREIELDTESAPEAAINDSLAVRLRVFEPRTHFYEHEAPALYMRPAGAERFDVSRLEDLPVFRERYPDTKRALRTSRGELMPSKRLRPQLELAGLSIPTGWFEGWTLPVDIDTPDDSPFEARVIGYVPYVATMADSYAGAGPQEDASAVDYGESTGAGADDGLNPALELAISVPDGSDRVIRQWLVARDPARSLLRTGVPFEFHWVESEKEAAELARPLAGPHELTIKVLDPPVEQRMAIRQGQTIEIKGAPYELEIKLLAQDWTMVSPGYENSTSPIASVDVKTTDKEYNRTVIQRFPHLSQDIDEQGVRHREGPYDPNLILKYRSAPRMWVNIIAGPDIAPRAAVYMPDGSVQVTQLPVGKTTPLNFAGTRVPVTIAQLEPRAERKFEPVLAPIETRQPITAYSGSAILVEFSAKDGSGDWTTEAWIPFSKYVELDSFARRFPIELPNGQTWEFCYSRIRHPLTAELAPGRLEVDYFPGRRAAELWKSEFTVRLPSGEVRDGHVETNDTMTVGRWTYFQSGAAQDHWSFTTLGVGNRNGIITMTVACAMITLGTLFAFYIKPILRRRQRLAAEVTTPLGRGVPAAHPAAINGRPAPEPHAGQREHEYIEAE